MGAAEGYAMIIRVGRIVKNHPNVPTDNPLGILHALRIAERELMFTPIEDFFSIFPPIKRYEDDGSWDYKSTLDFRNENFGTHFGRGDLMKLLMTRCYENKFVGRFGIAIMQAIGKQYENRTRRNFAGMVVDKFRSGDFER